MTGFVLSTLTLTAVYLAVLRSLQPGDVLVGGALAAAITAAAGRALPRGRGAPLAARLRGAPALALGTLADVVRGTWHVARYIVGCCPRERHGLVAIPRGERTRAGVAAWGLLTALSPDEVVVEVDEARGLLVIHVLDAGRAAAVRARHHTVYARRQRRVFP
jgi:multisubunit Na+/H+ antiporter MnhE subunit